MPFSKTSITPSRLAVARHEAIPVLNYPQCIMLYLLNRIPPAEILRSRTSVRASRRVWMLSYFYCCFSNGNITSDVFMYFPTNPRKKTDNTFYLFVFLLDLKTGNIYNSSRLKFLVFIFFSRFVAHNDQLTSCLRLCVWTVITAVVVVVVVVSLSQFLV